MELRVSTVGVLARPEMIHPPCRRCGIDLPVSRFNADGTKTKVSKRRKKDPMHCRDCQPYADE